MKKLAKLKSGDRTDGTAILLGSAFSANPVCTGGSVKQGYSNFPLRFYVPHSFMLLSAL